MSGIIPSETDPIRDNFLVTVALDIGTSFSGFAFLTREDFKINPLRVFCKQWQIGELGMLYKTKSIVLLNSDKKCVAFGYEAEQQYLEMETDMAKQHFFFKYFKMNLFGETSLRLNMKIADEGGAKIPAHVVFSESIRFLKNAAIEELQKSSVIIEEDIKWVITLPAIWSESAKQFMGLACKKAGIDEKRLEITLEPESAALFCNYLAIERSNTEMTVSKNTFENGRKFMVLDLGGGTVDITAFMVHTVESGKNVLKEIYKATGGPWGGRTVDDAFELFWSSLFGSEKLKDLQKEYKGEIGELFKRFEIQKRGFSDRKTISITLPECIREMEDLQSMIRKKYGEKITIKRGKITFNADTFTQFYKTPLTKLPEIITDLLQKEELSDIYAVLMVGGFSESELVQKAVKDTVGGRAKVFVPTEPGSIVLKGAVIYGFAPHIIVERVSRYTYGISTRKLFDDKIFSRNSAHFHIIDKEEYIEDVFYPFICVGDVVIPGYEKTHTFNAVALNSRGSLEIEIYASVEKEPEYTNDPTYDRVTWKIGCIEFPKFDKNNLGKTVNVTMKFGYTFLNVCAKLETGESVDCNLNLLK